MQVLVLGELHLPPQRVACRHALPGVPVPRAAQSEAGPEAAGGAAGVLGAGGVAQVAVLRRQGRVGQVAGSRPRQRLQDGGLALLWVLVTAHRIFGCGMRTLSRGMYDVVP